MDAQQFDSVIRRLAHGRTRRGALATLAGLAGAGLSAPNLAEAKKKKKKKVTICRNGQTLSVTKKKKRKHLKPGDTVGPCPTTTRPPATTSTTSTTLPPRCSGAKPNFCARLDTCLAACTAGHVFDAETCACFCSPATTCCVCKQGATILEFQNIATADACSEACTNAGGTGPVFAGGNGSAARAHPTEAECTITCTPEAMTCPAGFNPASCDAGTVCCPPEADGGCCGVDTPNCCKTFCCGPGFPICCEAAGGCCPAEAPLCCGAGCCADDSSCCSGDGDCDAGQICALFEGTDDGCCVDDPERSAGRGRAAMALAAPSVPRRAAPGRNKQRARRKRQA